MIEGGLGSKHDQCAHSIWVMSKSIKLYYMPSISGYLFIFFHVEENEPKEDARAPRCFALPCALSCQPERAETRCAQTVRALGSGHHANARRGTKGIGLRPQVSF